MLGMEHYDTISNNSIQKVLVLGDNKVPLLEELHQSKWCCEVMASLFRGYETQTAIVTLGHNGYDEYASAWANCNGMKVLTTQDYPLGDITEAYNLDLIVFFPKAPAMQHVKDILVKSGGWPITFHDATGIPESYSSDYVNKQVQKATNPDANAQVVVDIINPIEAYSKLQNKAFAADKLILEVNKQMIDNYLKMGGKL